MKKNSKKDKQLLQRKAPTNPKLSICRSFWNHNREVLKHSCLVQIIRRIYYCFAYLYSLRYLFKKRMGDNKTILIIIRDISCGGAERVSTILANELAEQYNIILMYLHVQPQPYPLSPKVCPIWFPLLLWHPNSLGKIYGLSCKLLKLFKKRQKVFVSISLLYEMNALNIASKAQDWVICSERSNPARSEDKTHFDFIQSIYEQADHVIFQSEAVRDLFDEKVKNHSSILPNPVRISCLRCDDTKHRIVTCGRLTEQKNHRMLLRAFGQFHIAHPDYTLSIYGEGSLRQELTDLIHALNLDGFVKLEGRSNQIHRDIADAEIFVLSSDYEGFSNALLEAMMMGFPCISTDCEGSVDIIEDGKNGLLVQRGDETELLSAMLHLAEDTDYRESLGRQAKLTVQRFKQENAVKEWIKVIEQPAQCSNRKNYE